MRMRRITGLGGAMLVCAGALWACGDGDSDKEGGDESGNSRNSGDGEGTDNIDLDGLGGIGSTDGSTSGDGEKQSNIGPQVSELWYSSGEQLVYIAIDPATGEVADLISSSVSLPHGQNAITMVKDGSLLGARLVGDETHFYLIENPPRDGGAVDIVELGIMPDNIGIEGLYTDCAGRLYAMDTGANNSSSEGNRLLVFTGDVLGGDFKYQVVSDLSSADVADIDDLGPGLTSDGELRDNPGIAIDTGNLYVFDYETGTGSFEAEGGRFGIHVLGGPLFDDGVARVYVLDGSANLHLVDVEDGWSLSDPLVQGPDNTASYRGHSGLTGPLTNCKTTFTYEVR